jgi:hypothetical protein
MILALISLLLIIFSIYLGQYVPFVWPDEVLFFNPAFEWYQSGELKTTVLEGLIPGMEKYTLWMSPLYMILLGLSFHIWDASIANARMLSYFIGIIAIFQFHSFLKTELKIGMNKSFATIAAVYLLIDVLLFKVSHTSRMETLCILMGLTSIFSAYRCHYFKAGILLGLSILSHPFGVFYSLPIVYLWFEQKSISHFKTILFISIGSLIALLPWIIYIIPKLDLFIIQFGAQLARKRELFELFTQFDKIRIYFSGYYFPILKLISILIILYFGSISLGLIPKKRLRNMLVVWLIAMLIGFYSSSESWYVVHSTFPLAIFFILAAKERIWLKNSILAFQGFLFIFFIYSSCFQENVFTKTNQFNQKVLELSQGKNKIYSQLIPDPYFMLKEKNPNSRVYEFIPGELSISSEFFQKTIESMDLFLFYDESLANSSIKELIYDNTKYKREEWEMDYQSKVPGKGPWKIFSYEKIQTESIEIR